MEFLKKSRLSLNNANTTAPGIILLLFSIVLSLCVYQHYGMSWDEPVQRDMGLVSYNYVVHHDPFLKSYIERDHGVGVELPLIFLEKLLRLKDVSDVYLMRHLACNIFYLFAAFCGYLLALRLFKNQWLAILGFLLFAFHPRLYAHSFFNSKDTPFYACFIICFLFVEIAFRKDKWKWHLLLGAVAGYTTGIRILAVILPAFLGLFYLADILKAKQDKTTFKQKWMNAGAFYFGYCMALYASWPILWHAPFKELADGLKSYSAFRWSGGLLLFGKLYPSANIPSFYLPGWFSVTVPELCLVLGVVGVLLIVFKAAASPIKALMNTEERQYLLYVYCFIIPPAMVILLHSIVYDDWRHVYFIYPSFVLVALWLLNKLSKTKLKYLLVVLCVLQLSDTAWFMIQAHPFEQVSFNHFVSHKDEYLRKNFDFEYWGCSYKQGYDYLLKTDTSKPIKIENSTIPLQNNTMMLNTNDRERIFLADEDSNATYFLTTFRDSPFDKPKTGAIVHEFKVLNSTVLRIQKIR